MSTLKGRALHPIRPGFIIKQVLLGNLGLANGQYVHEASVSDIHNAYRASVRSFNETIPRERRIHAMGYFSFCTVFKFARYLGLVEHVRDEPRKNEKGKLWRHEWGDKDDLRLVPGTRKIYRLTDKGREDDESWGNLMRAWYESKGLPYPPKPQRSNGEFDEMRANLARGREQESEG